MCKLNHAFALIDTHPMASQELSYEHAFGRKVRVNLDTYRGRGRAGDLSQTFEKRPEDSGTFFKNIKDSSTYTRCDWHVWNLRLFHPSLTQAMD